MGRACSTKGEKRNAYRILVGMPEGKRPLGRPRHTWVNNIRMDLTEIRWAQDRDQGRAFVNTVMKLLVFYRLVSTLTSNPIQLGPIGSPSSNLQTDEFLISD
jgi:hypothetical protein